MIVTNMRASSGYPTGQQYRVKSFSTEAGKRIAASRKALAEQVEIALSAAIKKKVSVNSETYNVKQKFVYKYEISPELSKQVEGVIKSTIYRSLLGSLDGDWAIGWWANIFMREAASDGLSSVSMELASLAFKKSKAITDAMKAANMVDDYHLMSIRLAAQQRAEAILLEPRNVSLVRNLYARSFESMKDLSDDMKKDIRLSMSRGVINGKSPSEIAKEIVDRTSVDEARALRIARTEINTAYNLARLEEISYKSENLFKDSPIELLVMHRSSFLKTTRTDHAKRHGVVSTVEQQNYWWDNVASGGRINCYCSTTLVMRERATGNYINATEVGRYDTELKKYLEESGS